MKYLKKYENYNNNIEIGDYVILDNKNAFWNNHYGIIVNIGIKQDYPVGDSNKINYLVKFLSDVNSITNSESVIEFFPKDFTEIEKNMKLVVDRKSQKYEQWFHPTYIKSFKSKDEFDKEVEKIELEKSTEKYNL